MADFLESLGPAPLPRGAFAFERLILPRSWSVVCEPCHRKQHSLCEAGLPNPCVCRDPYHFQPQPLAGDLFSRGKR